MDAPKGQPAAKWFSCNLLAEKNYHLTLPVLSRTAWQQLCQAEPEIPRTFSQLQKYARQLLEPRRLKISKTTVPPSIARIATESPEECGEVAWQALFFGLSNPNLRSAQRQTIETEIAACLPNFIRSLATEHFILRWTTSSPDPDDNITDEQIIVETGAYLEHAWERYTDAFGRSPYVGDSNSGAGKIEVVFLDLVDKYGSTSTNGPIKLDSVTWNTKPGLRKPVSAHELFHRMQYAFGFRTRWKPPVPYQWFSEGTASWAEVFVWGRISRESKLIDTFSKPDQDFFDTRYNALPFWVFFEARQKDRATDHPIHQFLAECRRPGGELKNALENVISQEWRENSGIERRLENFYALYALERYRDRWRTGPLGSLYPNILSASDIRIIPAIQITQVIVDNNETFTTFDKKVSPLGNDYYRFALKPDVNRKHFSLSITGDGDYACYLMWEKDNVPGLVDFLPANSPTYHFSHPINLAKADSLVLVISGSKALGTYTLVASVS